MDNDMQGISFNLLAAAIQRTEFALSPVDIAIILLAIGGVVCVGLWASRRVQKTTKSYFLASGNMPWWLVGAAFVSTSVSSEQIVGTIGAAYENGMGIANWEWFTLPIYTLVIVFFIPVYLKNKITTIPEFLRRRFGDFCGNAYSWIILFAYVFVFLVPVLYSGSLAIHRLTSWNFYGVLWCMAGIVGIYTIKGGLGSIMWTDAVQCVMLVGGGVLLFFLALSQIPGGWKAMEQANPERFHLYLPPNDPIAPFTGLLCATFGVFLFYQCSNQVMVQRVLSSRSTWDGMMGIIFAGFINLARPLVTCFLGFIVYHWIHNMNMDAPLKNLDYTFPYALTHFAPSWGLRGIVLAGFLAAVMSTISALTNSTATIFSLDVYKKLIHKDADEERVVTVGRITAGAALIIACLAAPFVERLGGVFLYFQTGVTYVATPFISVLLLGIFWKRTNYAGAIFGILGGIVIQTAFAIGFPMLFKAGILPMNLHWLYIAGIAQVVIMAGIVIVSLMTAPPDEEKWKPILWTPQLLSQYDQGNKMPWYKTLKLWYGIFAAIWLYLYIRFW
jgi:SSS family solute:Na+ symporter